MDDDESILLRFHKALSDAMRQLVAAHDIGEAATLLARLARLQLDADHALVSLAEEGGGLTSVCATDGVSPTAYRDLRLPLETPLPGLVADRPFQTTGNNLLPRGVSLVEFGDHLSDGLLSILGLPVRVGDELRGWLIVVDRRVRIFDQQEMGAVESLVTCAAVAFEVAHLKLALTDAGRQLTQLSELQEADARLLAVLAAGSTTECFESALSDILGTTAVAVAADPVTLLLDRRRLRYAPEDLETQLARSLTKATAITIPDGDRTNVVSLVPAVVGEQLLGAVGVYGQLNNPVQLLVLQRAALAFGALLTSRRTLEVEEARERADVLDALLIGRSADEHPSLVRRVRALGLNTSADMVVVIIEPVAASVRRVHDILEPLSQSRGIVAVRRDHVVAVVNASAAEPLAIEWARQLALRGANGTVAAELVTIPELAGGPGLAALPPAHDSAATVLSTALALGRRGEPCTQAMLGMAALVISGDTTGVTARIIRYAIGPLLDHDESRGTNYVETALNFLDENQRVSACAQRLHVHENTVRQRVARIDALLGPHWRSGARSLDTHLALRLHQLSRSDRHII